MVTALWSTKAGVGVSSVAAMFALAIASRANQALLVDLCGDAPTLLGLDDPLGLGVSDWTATPDRSNGALSRIEIEVALGLGLLARGSAEFGSDPTSLFMALQGDDRPVLVDCGRVDSGFALDFAKQCTQRLLVVRQCFLALHSPGRPVMEPTGVVIVKERNRALTRADVEAVVDAPVVAEIEYDPAISRAIDAGLIGSRLPRSLLRRLARVYDHVS